MLASALLHRIVSLIIALSMVLTPIAPFQPTQAAPAERIELSSPIDPADSGDGVLFRTHIAVDQPSDWTRLQEMEVVILEQGESSALVLADFDQLERLARLGYHPTGTDEIGTLVAGNVDAPGWLARSLDTVLERSATVGAKLRADTAGASPQDVKSQAVQESLALREALAALTPEQATALADLTSLDDDGDGLTNVEESWWCTDPLDRNSDGDAYGYTDGQEVYALLDASQPRSVRWGYGPPFGPPNAWPDFNGQDGNPVTPACNDGDFDTIPDKAEAFMVGTRVGTGDSENTDGDKFDDGQEFFGTTYCPGGVDSCGYGSYPRERDASQFVSPAMPDWIRPPGDSPFVAAYPVIDVQIDPATIRITTKEIRTIEKTITEGSEISEGFAETKGNSTSVGTIDTNTTSGWQEHSTTEGTITPERAVQQNSTSDSSGVVPPSVSIHEFWKGFQSISPTDIADNGSLLISNDMFVLSSASLAFDIQRFLAAHPGPLAGYRENFHSQTLSASEIIHANAAYYGVNSQVLLVILESSYSLLSVSSAEVPKAIAPIASSGSVSFFGFVQQLSMKLRSQYETAYYRTIPEPDQSEFAASFAVRSWLRDYSRETNETHTPGQVDSRFATSFLELFGNPQARSGRASTTESFPSGLSLPLGSENWRYNSGPHQNSGDTNCPVGAPRANCPAIPWSAIDLGTPSRIQCVRWETGSRYSDDWVVAATSGTVESYDSIYGTLIVGRNDGVKTYYTHIVPTGRAANGATIDPGDQIGHAGCIGMTDGAHVHFAVYRGGAFLEIDGAQLSGWTVKSNGYHYNGTMSQCNTTITSDFVTIPSTVDGCPPPIQGPCVQPMQTKFSIAGMLSNIKDTFWNSAIGRTINSWKGKSTGGSLRLSQTVASIPGCGVNASCVDQVAGRSNQPSDYSSIASGGQCPGSGPYPSESGFGIGGGGSGTAYNDDGGFTALRTWSETTTNGEGWSTSHSETRAETEYSEITRSTVNTLVSSEAWSTATTSDPTDAARLTFAYTLFNRGSDLAAQVTGLRINLLIGDLPPITWDAPNQTNLFPAQAKGPFSSGSIPLTLDQLAAIDNGAPIRIVLADYSYNDDLYDQNAWGRGVLFHVDDGTADGDETFDTYLIVTGLKIGETYQDTLARYFPVTTFVAGEDDPRNGTLTNIRTPEYDQFGEISGWQDHPINERAWWELAISTGGETDGVTRFQDMPAKPKTDIYLRYFVDTDGDGYTDRAEQDAGTDANNPDSHPRPLLVVAEHTVVDNNTLMASVQLSLQNLGNFDASSVEVWAIEPDDSITIVDNLVGGGGRVRAGRRVVLGARIGAPDLDGWGNATAKPYPGGQYQGNTPKTFYFRADTSGTIGNSGGLQISWSTDNATWTPLDVGSDYTPWNAFSLVDGVEVAFSPGSIFAGETFQFETDIPVDTFSYSINRIPYTPPMLIVSYNDAQGNHKFVTDVETAYIQEDLTRYYGDMRRGMQVDVVQDDPYQEGANQAFVVFKNPALIPVADGKVYIEMALPDGTVAKEYVLENQTFQPGPNVVAFNWNTADFSPAYDPAGDYHILAFVTDRRGTIMENTVKGLDNLGKDKLPAAVFSDTEWDFGTAQQGTLIENQFVLASIGYQDLLAYVGSATGISIEGGSDTTLPPGDVALYTVQLNTEELPVGTYETTIPVRTSDPQNPSASLTIRGTITPMSADAPGGAVIRPLDWTVQIAGDHTAGEWVEFTHTLGTDPESLHPVKVYSQDYGTLWGVGKYATDFSAEVASSDMFGDGADGDIVIDSEVTFDTPMTPLGETAAAGQNTVNLNNGSGFDPGSEIMLYQVQGTGAGIYEFARIVDRADNQVSLDRPLQHTFSHTSPSKAQAIRVPNYHNVTVTATGRWNAPVWNGNEGGLLVFRSNGTTDVAGVVTASYSGFRGNLSISNASSQGFVGESTTGENRVQSSNAYGNGGGGGSGEECCIGRGGGGGGNGTAGERGYQRRDESQHYPGGLQNGGYGGAVSGNLELTNMTFGGSGGEAYGHPNNGGQSVIGGKKGGAFCTSPQIS